MGQGATRQEERELRALEYVYDNDEGFTREPASIQGLVDLVGEEDAYAIGERLRRQGLIRADDRLAGGYHVTPEGKSEVEAMHTRRTDRSLRRIACRDQLLRWVDAESDGALGGNIATDHFEGSLDLRPFTTEEVAPAAEYLVSNGLLSSIKAWSALRHVALAITELGRECVDEALPIAEFLRVRKQSGTQTIHVHGSGNSISAAVGAGNTVTSNLSQFDMEKALQFAKAVREALPALGLPPDALEAIEVIEQRPEKPQAHRATLALYTLLMGTTTGTLGQVLGLLGASALGIGT